MYLSNWYILDSYFSRDKIVEGDTYDSSTRPPSATTLDYLELLTEPGIPPHHLVLKPTMVCSLMRNLSVEQGLVKSTRVIIEQCEQHSIGVRLLHNHSTKIYLPRITFTFTTKACCWSVERRQFLLKPAYATTFNSCQGLTLVRVVLDLSIPVFVHRQLYTSISRVRSQNSVAIILQHTDQILPKLQHKLVKSTPHELHVGLETLNIVYRQLL